MADFIPTLGLSQVLKQEQTLSPQMLQSLALLPMPILELKAHIQQEIEANPALEIPEHEFEALQEKDSNAVQTHNYDDNIDDADSSFYENYENHENAYESSGFATADSEASDRFNMMLENSSSGGKTLQEHLLDQLGEISVSPNVEKASQMLISDLDANGFYILQPKELFENSNFSQETIEKAIETIQSFDPNGICVKDFRESLILQAKLSGMAQSDLDIFFELVNTQLEKIKSGKTKEASQNLGISEEDLKTFVSILKSFTPYPGRNYGSDKETYIEPDIAIHNKDGSLVLDLNRAGIPTLEVSSQFKELSKELKGPESKEASKYINNCVKQANLLIDQVNLRFKTLYNAAVAIMDIQKDFFMKGPRYLKTMTLKDVAEQIGVHETTMSRLAQSKWVDTDWGLFQLKYFFSQGVRTSQVSTSQASTSKEEVQTVSRNVVKDMIKEIIQEKGALSDQKISDLLLEKGIKCARRTVGKYRTELNIDSSYERT